MKTRSDAFQFEKELDWEKPAPGIRRQIIKQEKFKTDIYGKDSKKIDGFGR